jgi:periplasmic mercuric ion binding protein
MFVKSIFRKTIFRKTVFHKTIALLFTLLSTIIAMPVSATNYEINVNGIVCEFCAFGVAKKLRKLEFVDREQYDDGIKVDIENQRVFISVKEGQAVDQKAIFEAIKSGGYDPIEMWPIDSAISPVEVTQ